MTIYNETLADGPALTDGSVAGLGALVEDRFLPTDFASTLRAVLPTINDTVTIADVATYKIGYMIFERIMLEPQALPSVKYHKVLADLVAVVDAIRRALPMSLAESFTLDAQLAAFLSLRLMEQLDVAEAVLPSLLYTQTVTERIRLLDSLARFFGAEAGDTIEIGDAAVGPAFKIGLAADTLNIAEAITPRLLIKVTAQDRVQVSDADLVHMVFSGWLSDGVEVSAGFLLPGIGFTTWAMNTRTAGVTEYQNYAFNSFARIGNKYLGASDDGLYELMGDDDDGESIIATIRSGFSQWAGAHLHSFKAAYLAVRGEGQFVLRLITGDGKTYNYTVSQDAMRTTKVSMGKGLRARYFAFELISSGQDFDLETLEFIPLVAQRRV